MHFREALGVLALVLVVVTVVAALRQGASGTYERIMRCRQGHLFTSTVVPGASVKAVRLGRARFQRCPVGRHWTLVWSVDSRTLTETELESARSVHDTRLP